MNLRQLQSTLIIGIFSLNGFAQQLSHAETVKAFQDSLNAIQKDSLTTQLLPEERASFEGLDFFPISEEFIVKAQLELDPDPHTFKLTYSNEPNVPVFISYGTLSFNLKGKEYHLHVYQKEEWVNDADHKSVLFLPFKDWTNGPQSYGGGRFMHLNLPERGDSITIDFNLSFNPPCAYNYYMACPLIPESNQIETEILAGIMTY